MSNKPDMFPLVQAWVYVLAVVNVVLGCPSGWVQHYDKCYLLSSFTANWPDAASYCRMFHSKLAEPMDQFAITFLSGEVKERAPLKSEPYYLGAGDFFVEGEWIWMSTEQPIAITHWNPNEPNDAGSAEDCLEIAQNGMWNDDVCKNPKGFICEMENEVAQGLIG